MEAAIQGRWLAREWSRSAWGWMSALAVAAIGPVYLLSNPLDIAHGGLLSGSYLDSIWYVSTYIGVLVGLALLERAGPFQAELGSGGRLWGGSLPILAMSLLYGLAAFLPLRALAARETVVGLQELTCAAHWTALGVFVSRAGGPFAAKCIVVTGLGWLLPALLEAAPAWDRLGWALSPERHLHLRGPSLATSSGLLVDTIPCVAWWVAAALLPTRGAFKR